MAAINRIPGKAFKEAVDGLPEDVTERLTVVKVCEDGPDETQ